MIIALAVLSWITIKTHPAGVGESCINAQCIKGTHCEMVTTFDRCRPCEPVKYRCILDCVTGDCEDDVRMRRRKEDEEEKK